MYHTFERRKAAQYDATDRKQAKQFSEIVRESGPPWAGRKLLFAQPTESNAPTWFRKQMDRAAAAPAFITPSVG